MSEDTVSEDAVSEDTVIEDTVIDVEGLDTEMGGVVIHHGLNLSVRGGEVMALIGGSGSGKTTLLRMMLGLAVPTRGVVRIFGHPLGQCARRDLEQVRHRWGVLFQQGALFSALDVFDNVAMPLRDLRRLPEHMIESLVMMKLALVGLKAGDARKKPSDLSGGMIKRVSLARALILDPQLLFLDEPTAGLDPKSATQFVALVRELRRELALTVMMVTHDVDTVLALVDRVAVLDQQRIIAVGPLAQIAGLQQPAFVKSFFLGHVARCAEDSIRLYRQSLDQAFNDEDANAPAMQAAAA